MPFSPRHPLRSPLALALAVALALPTVHAAASTPADGTPAAAAAAAPDEQHARTLKGVKVTAVAPHDEQMPTHVSLKAIQPQSIVGRDYIDNNAMPMDNYSGVAALSPSVVNIEPNGPGLGNNKGFTIRGMSDGQYNLTMDGIPVGDANDFTHHSSNYFMAQDLDSVTVDRGPGQASTIGYATFGGTVGMQTRDPLSKLTTTVYGGYGSFATRLAGVAFNTGILSSGGSGYLDYKQLKSNGYLTGATVDRSNVVAKFVQPVGDDTTLTFLAMRNTNGGGNAAIVGATSFPYVADSKYPYTSSMPGQMQVFGKNYGLSNNPQSQAYTGYNYDKFNSDFEYVGLTTSVGDVKIDNKLYTYAYYHRGWNGLDPNGGNLDYGQLSSAAGGMDDGTFPAGLGTTNGTVYSPTDVPGQKMYLLYRNWGDVLRFSQTLGPGELGYGIWANKQNYHRYEAEIDFSLGGALNPVLKGGDPVTQSTDRRIDGTFWAIQPYLQYAWHISDQLTFTPGLKYVYFKRHDIAPIQQKVRTAFDYSQTWKKALPSFDLHYAIDPHWAAYVQASEGYLAPNENLYYVANPDTASQGLQTQSTRNYQIGTSWRDDRWTLSGDLYAINFSNQISSTKVGKETFFTNLGGVKYRGAEIEGSVAVGGGFSLYGNASYNQAKVDKTGLQLKRVPKTTAAAGVLYHAGAISASLLAKHLGTSYGDTGVDGSGAPALVYPLPAVTIVNLSLNYTLQHAGFLPRGSQFGLRVTNLTNQTPLVHEGTTNNGVPLFYTVAGRAVMGTFSLPF